MAIQRRLILAIVIAAISGRTYAQIRPENDPIVSGDHTVQVNGLKLWYKVSGTGPVCIMPSPPWGVPSDLYFRTLKPLEKTFTLIYLDPRGCGRSDRAPSLDRYTWDDLCSDLDALRAHLRQERVWLMGHSEGGMYVLAYACKHSDRVRGMVLLDTAAVVDKASWADVGARIARRGDDPRFADAAKVMRERAAPKTDEEFGLVLKRMLPIYWSDPARIPNFAEDFDAYPFSATASQGQKASGRLSGFDLRFQLRRVTAPALIVVGADDFICPPDQASRIHLALPNSKLLLIEQAGHFPWMEQPDIFNTRVPEFLAALGLPTSLKRRP